MAGERSVRGVHEPAGPIRDGQSIAPDPAAKAATPIAKRIALFAAASEAGLEAALWVRPSEGTALVGIGRAWAAEAAGIAERS